MIVGIIALVAGVLLIALLAYMVGSKHGYAKGYDAALEFVGPIRRGVAGAASIVGALVHERRPSRAKLRRGVRYVERLLSC